MRAGRVGLVCGVVGLSVVGATFLVLNGWAPAITGGGFRKYIESIVPAGVPPTVPAVVAVPEPFCQGKAPEAWREKQVFEGVTIDASKSCLPDNPAEIAAFVKGTNNVSMETLMATRLSPDAVVKGADEDGDGDPDLIRVRLEVVELNGHSPDGQGPFPTFSIAPGILPGLWTFAPKTRGMATVNFESEEAHSLLRAPSPVIRVEKGDTIEVTLENTHYLPHTIHFHGVDHPFVGADGKGNDGTPLTSELPVRAGETRTYTMTPRQTGTMFYHCHVQPQAHILMGLQGMFVIEENYPDNWVQTLNVGAGRVRAPAAGSRGTFSQEYDLHYQDIDSSLNDQIQASSDPRVIAKSTNRQYNISRRMPNYFLLNGRSFPYTTRESLIVVGQNERVRLRVLNGGAEEISLHTHGHKVRVTHYDGILHPEESQITRDVVDISPAQRVDLVLDTTDDGLHSYGPGIWLLHDHSAKGVTTNGVNPGGNISAIVYEDYLGKEGQPRTMGMDWGPFFSEAYYRKEMPIWSELEDGGLLGEAADQHSPLAYALFVGIGLGFCGSSLFVLGRWLSNRRKVS